MMWVLLLFVLWNLALSVGMVYLLYVVLTSATDDDSYRSAEKPTVPPPYDHHKPDTGTMFDDD